ncbi:ORF77 [Ranid herpesvirus 1]|uniref:ORF77 n=1 Tax=Ranid herpesvirus 1 TaxID=85655 RepID=Q9YQZ1_9VIRU|nr:ORF77 [Ranid herpesvirus 1]AAD12274.1 ORF77 [Ranid herpesvirus 1]
MSAQEERNSGDLGTVSVISQAQKRRERRRRLAVQNASSGRMGQAWVVGNTQTPQDESSTQSSLGTQRGPRNNAEKCASCSAIAACAPNVAVPRACAAHEPPCAVCAQDPGCAPWEHEHGASSGDMTAGCAPTLSKCVQATQPTIAPPHRKTNRRVAECTRAADTAACDQEPPGAYGGSPHEDFPPSAHSEDVCLKRAFDCFCPYHMPSRIHGLETCPEDGCCPPMAVERWDPLHTLYYRPTEAPGSPFWTCYLSTIALLKDNVGGSGRTTRGERCANIVLLCKALARMCTERGDTKAERHRAKSLRNCVWDMYLSVQDGVLLDWRPRLYLCMRPMHIMHMTVSTEWNIMRELLLASMYAESRNRADSAMVEGFLRRAVGHMLRDNFPMDALSLRRSARLVEHPLGHVVQQTFNCRSGYQIESKVLLECYNLYANVWPAVYEMCEAVALESKLGNQMF